MSQPSPGSWRRPGRPPSSTSSTCSCFPRTPPKIQKVADAYQAKHPDVAIKMQSAPWDQYFQTAELRLDSKDKSVDLVYVDVPLIAGYASRGFLAPVDPNLDTSALVPSSLNAGKYDGKLYALPINNSAQVLFYNKKLFADAGVTPPDGLTPEGRRRRPRPTRSHRRSAGRGSRSRRRRKS